MYYTIVEATLSAPSLSMLEEALKAANLIHTLSNPELVATVFAPTNDAFADTLESVDLTFEELMSDVETLSTILLNHVVP